MRPVKQLPSHYYEHATLDLSQNKRAAIILNLVGIPLLLGWGWFFVRLAQLLNPTFMTILSTGEFTLSVFDVLLWLVTIFGTIGLHELVHGFFLWRFTGERPVYGYSWYYFYAGAPDWYLPRQPYIIVALAPLLTFSFVTRVRLSRFIVRRQINSFETESLALRKEACKEKNYEQ